MNKRQKRGAEFIVARGDASELLNAAEETFDQMAVAIKMTIEGAWIESVRAWRNHRLTALRGDALDQSVRVVPLVCDDETSRLILDQLGGLLSMVTSADGFCRRNDQSA